jgi:DNA polymerase V
MSEKPATHGGKRLGAGRKAGSGKYGEPTTSLRVPASSRQTVLDFVTALTAGAEPSPRWPSHPAPLRAAANPPAFCAPLFAHSVRAGFPSPADDYVAEALDLNEHLISHKEATFFLRAKGHSMTGAGIHDGDLLIVDRSLTASHRCVVIAVVDGEFTVKRLFKRGGKIRLTAENPDFAPIEFNEGQELQIWGVVTSVVHRLQR